MPKFIKPSYEILTSVSEDQKIYGGTYMDVKFICSLAFTCQLQALGFGELFKIKHVEYKFDDELIMIIPATFDDWDSKSKVFWKRAMHNAETNYLELKVAGRTLQEAEGVLPLDIETEIIVSTNLNLWIDIFNSGCSMDAHISMQELMIPLREDFKKQIPDFR